MPRYLYSESTFAERLNELLIENDLSQTQIAEIIDVEDSTISRYLSKQNIPKIEILLRLADYFNCSIDFLIGRKEYDFSSETEYKSAPPFSVQFKQLIQHFKTSRYKLIKLAVVPKTVIYYWETNKYQPSIDNIIRLADYFECSTDYVLGRVDYE